VEVLEQWVLLEGAFHAVYGIDLEDALTTRTFRWFSVRVAYLLAHDNPFGRFFAPRPPEQT